MLHSRAGGAVTMRLGMTALAPNREMLLQIAQQLPASPQVLLNLNELLTDVNSGLDDVAVLLRRDTALAARIIRISNSVVFGMSGRVATIEEAVNRVGYAEIYRLTGLAAGAQLADQHLPFYGITGPQLRDNTLLIALAAEALATRVGIDPRLAYTAALLRSTGKLVLERYARKSPQMAGQFFQSGIASLLTWEQAAFGCTNVDVAEIVLSTWRFPISIVQPVRRQYLDTWPDDENRATCALLYVACGVAHRTGLGFIGEHEQWAQPAAAMDTLGLTPSLVSEATEEAKTALEAVKGML